MKYLGIFLKNAAKQDWIYFIAQIGPPRRPSKRDHRP